MIRVLLSIFLSILLHIYFFSFIKINNQQKKNINKKTQIVYIKKKEAIVKDKIKIPKLSSDFKENKINKPIVSKSSIIKNTDTKKEINNIKKNEKTIKKDKVKELSKEEIEIQKKLEILRKNPYFKNWSDERIKKLELPPGMKNWEEVEKMTEYLDTQYNWVYTPPNLGNNENKITWKEFNIKNNIQIRFIFDNTIFIAEFQEERNTIFVTYFYKNEKINENFDIPENIKDEEINFFEIEITKNLSESEEKNTIIYEYIEKIIDYYKNIDNKETKIN